MDAILRQSYVQGHVERYAQHVMALSPLQAPPSLGVAIRSAEESPGPAAKADRSVAPFAGLGMRIEFEGVRSGGLEGHQLNGRSCTLNRLALSTHVPGVLMKWASGLLPHALPS